MFELLSRIFKVPKMFFGAIMANPIGIFISSILAKWYVVVMFAAVMVAYWVLKGLEQAGVLGMFQGTLLEALYTSKSIAQYCTPLIMDLKATWDCISNPPVYNPTGDESSLQKAVDGILDFISGASNVDNNPVPASVYAPDYSKPTNPYE